MIRVSAHAAAAAVLASSVLVLAASTPAYAAANPHNPGHHYGQLKNGNHGHHYGQLKHVPAPNPVPTPVPTPPVKPVNLHLSRSVDSTVNDPLQIPLLNPTSNIDQPAGQILSDVPKPAPADPFWWMILALFPSLGLLLLIAMRGLVLRALRRPEAAPLPVAQPAAV